MRSDGCRKSFHDIFPVEKCCSLYFNDRWRQGNKRFVNSTSRHVGETPANQRYPHEPFSTFTGFTCGCPMYRDTKTRGLAHHESCYKMNSSTKKCQIAIALGIYDGRTTRQLYAGFIMGSIDVRPNCNMLPCLHKVSPARRAVR